MPEPSQTPEKSQGSDTQKDLLEPRYQRPLGSGLPSARPKRPTRAPSTWQMLLYQFDSERVETNIGTNVKDVQVLQQLEPTSQSDKISSCAETKLANHKADNKRSCDLVEVKLQKKVSSEVRQLCFCESAEIKVFTSKMGKRPEVYNKEDDK